MRGHDLHLIGAIFHATLPQHTSDELRVEAFEAYMKTRVPGFCFAAWDMYDRTALLQTITSCRVAIARGGR